MDVDLTQCLVAYAGEVITCPECSAALLQSTVDLTWPLFSAWLLAAFPLHPECWRCGTAFVRGSEAPGGGLLGVHCFVSASEWTGWRGVRGD